MILKRNTDAKFRAQLYLYLKCFLRQRRNMLSLSSSASAARQCSHESIAKRSYLVRTLRVISRFLLSGCAAVVQNLTVSKFVKEGARGMGKSTRATGCRACLEQKLLPQLLAFRCRRRSHAVERDASVSLSSDLTSSGWLGREGRGALCSARFRRGRRKPCGPIPSGRGGGPASSR